jgi:peptidoglycan hydrolase-like protein with peptidoglycan-binding domain
VYTTLQLKSTGADVTALQKALNQAGYNLDVDGFYGEYTREAVRDYQMKNGLTADGIASDQTLSKLYGTGGSAMTPSSGLADLINQFNKTPGYTPKTDAEIREQAEGEFQSYYDQLRQAAQQSYDRSDLALQQQKEGLQQSYDKQREQSAKSYRQAYSQADRQMLSRGMQRSSYGAQTLSNIDLEGAEAQQAISDQQAAAEGNIDAQRSQLAQQLAAQLAQYDSSKAADVLNRIRELEDQEYDRGVNAANTQNSLAAQIYQFLYQEQRDAKSDYQWQKEFDANYGGTGSGGGGGGSGGGTTTPPLENAASGATPGMMDWATFMSLLAGLESGTTSQGGTATPPRKDTSGARVFQSIVK